MTLHDVNRLNAHWRRVPPLRALVMAVPQALGVKVEPKGVAAAPPAPTSKYMTDADAKRFIAMTGGRIDGAGHL